MCALIILFFIFLFVTKNVLKVKSDKEICKADVYGKAALGIKPLKKIQELAELFDRQKQFTSDVNCPTQEISISENLDTKQGQTKAKETIAKAMYDCWDQFWEGKKELFESKAGTEMYCVICHHITFKEKDKEIKGIIDYLDENLIPSNDISYYEYLTGYETGDELRKFKEDVTKFTQQHNAKEIVTSSDYAVTFFYFKQGYIDKIKGAVIGMVSGAGAAGGIAIASIFVAIPGPGWIGLGLVVVGTTLGVVLGSDKSADWKSGVMLIPLQAEELSDLGCSYLPAKQDDKEH